MIGRGFLREIQSHYQERDHTSIYFFLVFLPTVPFTNETTTAMMEQIFFDTIRFYDHDLRNKTEWCSWRSGRRQQRQFWYVNKNLVSTAAASIVGPVIERNVIQTMRVLLERTSQDSAVADDHNYAIIRPEKDYVLPVERTLTAHAARRLLVQHGPPWS